MPKYLFVFGRNPELSSMELFAFCRTRGINLKVVERTDFTLVAEGNFNPGIISLLGGTVKIAEVAAEISTPSAVFFKYRTEELKNKMEQKKEELNCFFSPVKEFGISIYPRSLEQLRRIKWKKFANFFGSYFKEKISGRPDFMISSRYEPWLNAVEVNKKKFTGSGLEIVVALGDKTAYVCRTLAVYNPFEFEARDIEKAGRELLNEKGIMPPKLARIMANLSEVKEGGTLLDPFCGSGTILCEAMLCGINTIGIDISAKCIDASGKNVKKIEEKIQNKIKGKVILGDVRRLPLSNEQIDGIATEPYLGKLFRKKPRQEEAEKTVRELVILYTAALCEMKRVLKPSGKIIFISPVFATSKGNKKVPMEKIAKQLGLKITGKVLESRENQMVMREIWILEK